MEEAGAPLPSDPTADSGQHLQSSVHQVTRFLLQQQLLAKPERIHNSRVRDAVGHVKWRKDSLEFTVCIQKLARHTTCTRHLFKKSTRMKAGFLNCVRAVSELKHIMPCMPIVEQKTRSEVSSAHLKKSRPAQMSNASGLCLTFSVTSYIVLGLLVRRLILGIWNVAWSESV